MKLFRLASWLDRRELRSSVKFSIVLVLLWVLPVMVMLAISLGHLRTIQDVAVERARTILFASQTRLLAGRLSQEAERLSTVFSRIEDETYSLAYFARTLLAGPANLSYKNGSSYALKEGAQYCSPADDGNSALYVYKYRRSHDRVIAATEALDLVLKPLTERESRVVLGWIIHRDEIARAYPWRDFSRMPPGKVQTSWPFYYLADAEHNPDKKTLFTPPYLDPLTREWMISCLSPVYGKGGHLATVGVDVTIHKLLQEISNLRFSSGTSVMLVADGEIIAASANFPLAALHLDPAAPPHGQKLGRSDLPAVKGLAAGLNSDKENISFVEMPALRLYAGHSTIEPLGWKIVLLVPENEFIGMVQETGRKVQLEMRNIIGNYIHILIFALLGVVGATLLLFLHQSKGLRTLLTGIRRLGEGDLAHRIPEDQTEFGQLARALNTMALNLLEKKAELLRITAEVEQGRKLSAVGQLAAGVAHEVNNPLATISTYTQLLLRRSDLPAGAADNLRKVMTEIERIQTQLRNLLDLSRLQSPITAELDPDAVIREVTGLVGHEAASRGVELCLSLGGDCRRISADRSGLKQVIWNLLGNALDTLERGGKITIRSYDTAATGAGHEFVLEVEDDGPGIPATVLPHIFEPFFTTKEFGKGTGLGLAVVYGIVTGHGGTVSVQNMTPHGCLFRVVLPGSSSVKAELPK